MSTTYAKLNCGRVVIVYSDNEAEQTIYGYPVEQEGDFDPTVDVVDEFNYSDIAVIDSNLVIVQNWPSI